MATTYLTAHRHQLYMILGVQELVLLGIVAVALLSGPNAVPAVIRILGRFPVFRAPLRKIGRMLSLYNTVTDTRHSRNTATRDWCRHRPDR